MNDVLISGATVVDGTGAPGVRADVAVRDGRVVSVGATDEPAARRIDATGLVLAPGFVDLHTHYDVQLMWDPMASPSPLHGVTTVIGGNCGFSLAPAGVEHADYLQEMMAKVEGMPLPALQAGPVWSWTGFEDYLERLDGAIAVNAGFLVGHSTVRRVAMGDESGGPAGADAVAAMVREVHAALDAGALGFSTSQAPTHHDGTGSPVPSRSAAREELLALCAAVGEHPGTTLELILPGCLAGFSDAEMELMADLSVAAGRPVNWNVLGVSAANPGMHERQLAASDVARRRGGRVVALTLPHPMRLRLSFLTGFVFDGLPGWGEVFALAPPERIKALRDPETRRRLAAGARSKEAGMLRGLAQWERLRIAETFAPVNDGLAGRTVGEAVAERQGDAFDVLCDIVVADELRTGLRPPVFGEDDADWRLRAQVWLDDRTVVGGSDAGAHLDMMCGAVYSTSLLGEGVRERQLIGLEEAVRQLTDLPARLYGLTGRGRIAPGWHADLVLFDPERIGPGAERTRYDLPGGAPRLYAEADGIEHVLVGGVPIVSGGIATGATPGAVLRSGRDTETVSLP